MLLTFILMCNYIAFSADFSEVPSNRSSNAQAVIKARTATAAETLDLTPRNTVPVCHICCTYAVTDADGNVFNATACAGWFLTSCDAAAEKACERARAVLGDIVE
jgi:hypothetical protein